MDKQALRDEIERARAELEEVVARIPEDRFEQTGADGTWSPKDQLSHLAAWHEVVAARMRTGREEDALELPPGYADLEIDDVNAFFAGRDAGRSRAEAHEAFERTYRDVLAALDELDEGKLERPFRVELPDRRLIDTIRGNTTWHYEEHLPMLRVFAD